MLHVCHNTIFFLCINYLSLENQKKNDGIKIIEINTMLKFHDTSESKKKAHFEMTYTTVINLNDEIINNLIEHFSTWAPYIKLTISPFKNFNKEISLSPLATPHMNSLHIIYYECFACPVRRVGDGR